MVLTKTGQQHGKSTSGGPIFSPSDINVMHFPFLHPIKHNLDEHPMVVRHEKFDFTSEGSEFLDDALRMEDVTLPEPEEDLQDKSIYPIQS